MSDNKKVLGHKLQDYFRYWNRETPKWELVLFIASLFVSMFSPIFIIVVFVLSWFYALYRMKSINAAREIQNELHCESDHLEGEAERVKTADARYAVHEQEHEEHGTTLVPRAEWDLKDVECFVQDYVAEKRHLR